MRVNKNNITNLFISIFLFLITGCATYNTPFINTDETLKLREGMTQQNVKETLGQPLYVKSGVSKWNEVVWVYEVRTILVKSDATTGEPNKVNYDIKHSSPNHQLQVTFKDSKVISWGKLIQENPIPILLESPKKKKKLTDRLFILPRIGLGSHKEGSNQIIGGSIGYSNTSLGSFGVDLMGLLESDDNYLGGFGVMITYERPYNQFLIQGGIGWTMAWWEEEYYLDWEDYSNSESTQASGLGLRLGIAYEKKIGSHFVIKPAYERNMGFNGGSGFSGINLNFGWK